MNKGILDAELFASSQMMKPFSYNKPVNRKITRQELLKMQAEAKDRVRNLLKDTSLIPRELVFVGRSLNIIRGNNKLYGSPVDRVSVLARYAFKGSAIDQNQKNKMSLKQTLAVRYEEARFEFTLFAVWAAFQLTRAWQYVNSIFGKKVVGFEEKLEELEKQAAEQFGFQMQTDAG